jgi:fatty-acyl-CoA synthase
VLLTEVLRKAVRLYPRQRAVVCGERSWTYAEFGERVNRLSQALLSLGVAKGDRVGILHRNCHRYLECYFGVMQIGAVLVPMNYRLRPSDWVTTMEDSGARLVVVEDVFREQLESVADSMSESVEVVWSPGESVSSTMDQPQNGYESLLRLSSPQAPPEANLHPEDMAQIYYTTGTTGRGKGVVLTHRNVCVHALGTVAEFKLDDGDVWIHTAPMFHLADSWAVWSITWVGGAHVLLPEFSEHGVLDAIEKEGVTTTSLITTMLNALVNWPQVEEYDLSSLRFVVSGGSAVARKLIERAMETFGCEVAQIYGMTETSPCLAVSTLKHHLRALSPEEQMRFRATTGHEFITVELRVVDEDGHDVKPDGQQVGEIIVRGDSVMKEYWNLPELTERVFEDGWLHTADMAVMDEEGYVTIVDRQRDVIVTDGENVYSVEVENLLYSHPAVLEAAVIGVPDEQSGEAVKAVIVLREGQEATEEEIIGFCREHLADSKVPKSVDFVSSLPKTGSAKIAKVVLKEGYWAGMSKGMH